MILVAKLVFTRVLSWHGGILASNMLKAFLSSLVTFLGPNDGFLQT
jgi:hypothetical protein